jgi:dihydroorotate dehydrogenase (NAD+) catalytic subunit
MVELAPRHKYGLTLTVPVMPASGTFGYGDAYQDLVDVALLGAVVTNPVSLRSRRTAPGRRIGVRGDAFVVHTGWPNPGLNRVIRTYSETWERLPIPVIVHLLASRPEEVAQTAARLSGVAGVAGIELGFPATISVRDARATVEAAANEGDLPVIAKIPFGRVERLAPILAAHGADALTLTAPPRAVLPVRDERAGAVARFMRGRLYGAALFPLLLDTLSYWARRLPVPVIACGGIASPEDALACLTLGAAAVQIDALLWREPALLDTVARALVQPQKPDSVLAESSTEQPGMEDEE